MSKNSSLAGAFAVAALSLAAVAFPSAADASFIATTTLLGANQRPDPVATPAFGTATVTYDSSLGTLAYQVTYADLTTPSAVGHIHVGPVNGTGPVVLPFESFPAGTTSASFGGVGDDGDVINAATTGSSTIAQVAAQIEAGNAYVNIHSVQYPNGEIRGQLAVAATTPVPEPASLALLGAGVLAAAAARRKGRPSA